MEAVKIRKRSRGSGQLEADEKGAPDSCVAYGGDAVAALLDPVVARVVIVDHAFPGRRIADPQRPDSPP